MTLALLTVNVSKLLSILVKNTFIPVPKQIPVKLAIIPPKGFLCPYLNNIALIGSKSTNPISPNKLDIILSNTNIYVILFFLKL